MPANYTTKNLYEGAFLSLTYVPTLEKSESGEFLFIFPPEAEKLSLSYWAGKVDANLKGFTDAVRTLKERMQAQK